MGKKHVPLTVRAREIIDHAGGIKNITADQLCQELNIEKKVAWRLMWQIRHHPNTGKGERGPYSRVVAHTKSASQAARTVSTGHTKGFIHPHSAAARLLGALDPDLSREEQAFLAVIQLIGVARAESLLQDFKARLTKEIHGAGVG